MIISMDQPEIIFDFSSAFESYHAQNADAKCTITWKVPADLPYLNGHFPQMPVVPAVALIDASIVLIKQLLRSPDLHLKSVKQAKFLSPLTIGDEVTIDLHARSEGFWDIDWKNAQGQFSARLSLQMV